MKKLTVLLIFSLIALIGFAQPYIIGDASGNVTVGGDLTVTGSVIKDHGSGLMNISTGGTFTITTGGAYEKMIGGAIDYGSDHLEDFNETTNGRLTYTGTLTKHFLVTVNVSIEAGENAQFIGIRIAESGTSIAMSEQVQDFDILNSHNSIPVSYIVELATNEYVEIFITSDQDGDNIIVHSGVLTLTEY